jgi:hypothetical protein
MKYRIPKKSDRKKLREEIGRLHLQILRIKRGDRCEICQVPSDDLARFHIITVAADPRLEFIDENVLIYARNHWHCCHEPYHRDIYGVLGQRIVRRIEELRGKNYRRELKLRSRYVGRMSGMYLLALRENMKQELETLKCDK